MSAAVDLHPRARAEIERLRAAWPDEFEAGFRYGYAQEFPGKREDGCYPRGFSAWPEDRRNAWWAGCNQGWGELAASKREAGCELR
jgi:hypothetical protein